MPHIETNFNRFLQRMEAVQAFVSLRSFESSTVSRAFARSSKPAVAIDFDISRTALSGPGWYDSSWDLIQGLVVRETTAAGAGRLDDWSQCLFA
jgi:hypothetical protein